MAASETSSALGHGPGSRGRMTPRRFARAAEALRSSSDPVAQSRLEAALRLLEDDRAGPALSEVVLSSSRQQLADRRWNDRLGPFLSRSGVAEIMGISSQAVAKRRDLLAIRTRRGWAYPTFQFAGDGAGPLDGIEKVLEPLMRTGEPLLAAVWLMSPHPDLDQRTPLQAVADGDLGMAVAAAKDYGRALVS